MTYPYPIVPYPPMLPILDTLFASGQFAELWADEDAWSSLRIDYHPPYVDRLYVDTKVGSAPVRVMLHRVYPCEKGEALWHAHPWPCAVAVLDGCYEHGCGFVDRTGLRTVARSLLTAGSVYEMTDPKAVHYVRPTEGSVLSVMVCGKPWKTHDAPRPAAPLRELDDDARVDLHARFGDLLAPGWRSADTFHTTEPETSEELL